MNFSGRSCFCFLCAIVISGLGAMPLLAQQTQQLDIEISAPKKKKARTLKKQVDKEPLVKPDGILTKAFQSKAPWQLVSPFAPDSYGNGEEMVSQDDSQLGKQNGLILFGVEW
ncbi:MAG: hypothetical protein K2W99_00230 [Chthoniobacterales bacterium]|nr:hypothetical protein [Chthoniobacterales bacterium]